MVVLSGKWQAVRGALRSSHGRLFVGVMRSGGVRAGDSYQVHPGEGVVVCSEESGVLSIECEIVPGADMDALGFGEVFDVRGDLLASIVFAGAHRIGERNQWLSDGILIYERSRGGEWCLRGRVDASDIGRGVRLGNVAVIDRDNICATFFENTDDGNWVGRQGLVMFRNSGVYWVVDQVLDCDEILDEALLVGSLDATEGVVAFGLRTFEAPCTRGYVVLYDRRSSKPVLGALGPGVSSSDHLGSHIVILHDRILVLDGKYRDSFCGDYVGTGFVYSAQLFDPQSIRPDGEVLGAVEFERLVSPEYSSLRKIEARDGSSWFGVSSDGRVVVAEGLALDQEYRGLDLPRWASEDCAVALVGNHVFISRPQGKDGHGQLMFHVEEVLKRR